MSKCRALLFAGLACSLPLAACGSDEPADPLDPSTFAGKHQDAIGYDCELTLMCKSLRARLNEGDSQERCAKATAELLNTSSPEAQLRYLVNVNNCANQAACAYYDCTLADAETFGTQHQDKAAHRCQALVECQVATGALSGDAQAAYDNCVLDEIVALGGYSSDEQRLFLERYNGCASLASCDFNNCFLPVR